MNQKKYLSSYLDLMKEWNYEENKKRGNNPDKLTHGSSKSVAWICSKGHKWDARISNRTINKRGCPYCANKKICADNNLEVRYPELAKEWDTEFNKKSTCEIFPHSNVTYYWICPEKGHRYLASPNNRTTGDACPLCSGNQVSKENCLAANNPMLSKEWHPKKNGKETPYDVTVNSNKKVWWLCENGHEWQAKINNRSNGRGCKQCAKGKQSSFPEQAIFFYLRQIFPYAINGYMLNGKTELDIFIPKYKLAVEYDGYRYHGNVIKKKNDEKKNQNVINLGIKLIRVREKGCISLIDNGQVTINCEAKSNNLFLNKTIPVLITCINDLLKLDFIVDVDINRDRRIILKQYQVSKKEKSLLIKNPELVKEWDLKKNEPLKPDMIYPGSEIKVWWICSNNSTHRWEALVNSRNRGVGCPYCAGKRTTKDNSLASLFPQLLNEWDYEENEKIGLDPYKLTRGSSKKAFWICNLNMNHKWRASISDRTRGRKCPYCAGQKVSIEMSLKVLNPKLAKQWDYEKNGDLKPEDILPGSGKKVWWKCDKGHKWQAVVASRNKGRGCLVCANENRRK
jgi:hypothetical protein